MERTPHGDLVFRAEALFNENIKCKGLLAWVGPAPAASATRFPSAALASPFLSAFKK